MALAVVFPGQGAQEPGMGKDLFHARSEARDVFARVSEAVGVDMEALCFHTDAEVLRRTENAQIALYTVSMAALSCLRSHINGKVRLDLLAGHSVGEYAAVAAHGSITLEDGAKLVRRRGELMAEAGRRIPGTMAAILGLDREVLEACLAGVQGTVVVANDNCPGQIVISGEVEAVAAAGEAAAAAGAKRVIPLNVSGAFHSPLMNEASEHLFDGLTLDFKSTSDTGPVYSNVTAEAVGRESAFPDLLHRGLRSPVRWTESVQNMIRDEATTFIECGSGTVLSGLIKRIDRGVQCLGVRDMDSLEQCVAAVRG